MSEQVWRGMRTIGRSRSLSRSLEATKFGCVGRSAYTVLNPTFRMPHFQVPTYCAGFVLSYAPRRDETNRRTGAQVGSVIRHLGRAPARICLI